MNPSGRSTGTILVADDEPSLRHLLRAYLVKEGFDVIEAADGAQAMGALDRHHVDLALIDVMLPEMDGFEVIRRTRRRSTVPIILVTARGEETNRVAGFELGADDYVVKPFSAPEVIARVRAHLRRARGLDVETVLRVGAIEVDPAARLCSVDGEPVALTRREFDLLVELLRHVGRVLTRDQLLEAAWETSFVSPKTVDVHVASLRRKIGSSLRITALRGVGYRLEAS
jgi:DNA-binding response OmpR family regulator